MADTRHKNVNWDIGEVKEEASFEQVKMALLMDIRDELHKLNALLSCHNFTDFPFVLRDIRSSVARLDRRAKKKVPLTRQKKKAT